MSCTRDFRKRFAGSHAYAARALHAAIGIIELPAIERTTVERR